MSPKFLIAGSIAIVALAGTTIGATTIRGSGQSSVVPPRYYTGSDQNDTIYGTNGPDVLLGRGGNDTLFGLGGNDVLEGGTGNDVLWGGPGRDIMMGGPGNDRFHSRDGKRDIIDGGPGFDTAWVDRLDVVKNVERVYRR
jgi:Ca2+-binding RTX toxin-like protein